MARLNAVNFAGSLQFPYATTPTDLFKKEDVQTLAQAVDQHDHTTGKGLVLTASSISMPFTFPNGATMDGPTATPSQVNFSQDVQIARNLKFLPGGGTLSNPSGTQLATNGDFVVNGMQRSGNVGIGIAAVTYCSLYISGTENAQSSAAYAISLSTTLVAQNNNDVLYGLNFTPTYNNNGKTGVQHVGISLVAGTGINDTSFAVAREGGGRFLLCQGNGQVFINDGNIGPANYVFAVSYGNALINSGTLLLRTATVPFGAGCVLGIAGTGQTEGGYIIWSDAGGGMFIIGTRSYASVASNCFMNFYIANGSVNGYTAAMSLYGNGQVVVGGAGGSQNMNSNAVLILAAAVGNRLNVYDGGGGTMAGFGINSAEISTCIISGWVHAWRVGSYNGTIVGSINYAGQLQCGANFSPAASAAQSPTYAISTLNAGGANGQIIAFAHPTYASVDHAQEYGLRIAEVPDPIGLLHSVNAYSYDHASIDQGGDKLPLKNADGVIETTPTYGMSAAAVAVKIPECAALDEDGTPIGVAYDRMVPILWSACQLLEQRIAALEAAA